MSWIIYKHTNKNNGKSYIGQTRKKPKYRWNNGKGYTIRNPESHFARAIKKYGWDSFEHTIIEDNIESQVKANERETYWIKYFDTVKNGYNANYGGDAIGEVSSETKQKLSNASKTMWKEKGDELRKIYSSEEHKKKLSKAIRQNYKENPRLKEKLSEIRKNKTTITNGLEIKVINKGDLPMYKQIGWVKGEVYIPKTTLGKMLGDYLGPSDLSIHELETKYNFDDKIIRRAFIEKGIKIKSKSYKVWEKVRGSKRSEEFKKKHSDLMREQRAGRIFVTNGTITKSIYPSQEKEYLSIGWRRGRAPLNSTNMGKPDSVKKKVIRSDGKIYSSITEATKDMQLSQNAIRNVLTGRPHAKTAGGYGWKYYDEDKNS